MSVAFGRTDPPFCIAVLGDFSGRGHSSTAGDPPTWRPVRATPENLPALAGITVTATIPGGGRDGIDVLHTFAGLDDFSPDSLYESLQEFRWFQETREGIVHGNIGTTGAGALQARGTPRSSDEAGVAEPGPGASNVDLLDAVLDETAAVSGGQRGSPDEEIRSFVKTVLRSHRVAPTADRSGELSALDLAAAERMRRILHAEPIQALESIWRSVVFLLSRADQTGKVRVYLVDACWEDVAQDLEETAGLADSMLYRLLARPNLVPGCHRWALVVGAYSLGSADAELAERVASLARAADVLWLSAASASLVEDILAGDAGSGWPSPETGEESAATDWLALAYPAFLVREAYGAETGRRCRSFAFEELDSGGEAELPWGNSGFACAALLAQAFVRHGWGFSPDELLELEQMAVAQAVDSEDPPTVLRHRLTPDEARRLAEAGIIPVVEFPYHARVRVGGFRPVSGRPERLASWWLE